MSTILPVTLSWSGDIYSTIRNPMGWQAVLQDLYYISFVFYNTINGQQLDWINKMMQQSFPGDYRVICTELDSNRPTIALEFENTQDSTVFLMRYE